MDIASKIMALTTEAESLSHIASMSFAVAAAGIVGIVLLLLWNVWAQRQINKLESDHVKSMILATLSEGTADGYSIMLQIQRWTDKWVSPGTLYRTIAQLVREGYIEDAQLPGETEPDDKNRKYFRLANQDSHKEKNSLGLTVVPPGFTACSKCTFVEHNWALDKAGLCYHCQKEVNDGR